MIVPNTVRRWYDDAFPYLDDLAQRVRELVSPFCRDNQFLYEDRLKTLESLTEKIETGRFRDWNELDDLFACTIVIPLVTDEPAAIAFLRETFVEIDLRQRNSTRKPPDVFRFDSTRFIGRLRRMATFEDEGTRSIYDFPFEIQVKTVFEFAWTRTTHALAYKGEHVSWERQRLAAQLKAATEQLDMLVHGFDAMSSYAPQCQWPGITDRSTIEAFFKRKVNEGAIPAEFAPKDWTRFADNVYALMQSFSDNLSGGSGSRNLANLKDLLEAIEREISELGVDRIPRSISLLQFVAGVLGSMGKNLRKKGHYYFLLTDDLKSLYPSINLPCEIFGKLDDE